MAPGSPAAHQRFMRLALELARSRQGRTHPNPTVGAVIVRAGRVVGRGLHERAGAPHAEAAALKQAGERAKGATLYSTLEPCNHHGRTPPCTEAIIAAGVKTVVFGAGDPNPLVNGKGAGRLKRAGVAVLGGVLAEEARLLNRPYERFITTGLPFVTLKAALTLDGAIATAGGESKWITSEAARGQVHALRDTVDAVLVGVGTVLADDPQLTTRLPGGRGRSPVRVILDPRLKTPLTAKVLARRDGVRVIIATAAPLGGARAKALLKQGAEVWHLPERRGWLQLPALLESLAAQGLLHLLLEGGSGLYGSFIRAGLVDEYQLYLAGKLFGAEGVTFSGLLGVTSVDQAPRLELVFAEQVGPDLRLVARPVADTDRR